MKMQKISGLTSSDKIMLKSSFVVSASLKANLRIVEAVLNELPALKEVSNGTLLVYAIIKLDNGRKIDSGARLLFEKASITYEFYHSEVKAESRNIELAKFLSVLAYVNKFYDIDFSSIYHHIIESLLSSSPVYTERQREESLEERIKALSSANLSLSRIIYEKVEKVKKAEAELAAYRKMLQGIVGYISGVDKERGEMLLRSFGINKEAWSALTNYLGRRV